MSLVPGCVRCDAPIDAYGRDGTLCGKCKAATNSGEELLRAVDRVTNMLHAMRRQKEAGAQDEGLISALEQVIAAARTSHPLLSGDGELVERAGRSSLRHATRHSPEGRQQGTLMPSKMRARAVRHRPNPRGSTMKDKELVERLRQPSDTPEVMAAWDSWRKYIKEGGGASWPRDAFECLLDNIDEERAEAADRILALSSRIERLEGERANTCEAPEAAAMRYIEQLRDHEGACITICCDNPEANSTDERLAVDCVGDWTDWQERRFTGESVLQCLAKAVHVRQALSADGGKS